MQIQTNPKSSYLLEAGLDVLHFESRKWLSEIEFLKSELRFFLKLLRSRVFELYKEKQRQHILENMDKLATTVVEELELEIQAHEKKLASLLLGKNSDDASYRTAHNQLRQRMEQLDNDVRTLKMLVFDFTEHLN